MEEYGSELTENGNILQELRHYDNSRKKMAKKLKELPLH